MTQAGSHSDTQTEIKWVFFVFVLLYFGGVVSQEDSRHINAEASGILLSQTNSVAKLMENVITSTELPARAQ